MPRVSRQIQNACALPCHAARSRGIHASLSLQHGCCDYAQHDGLVIPGVTAEPKLRHSVRSRGIHASLSLHLGCCDYAQHDGLVISGVTAQPKLRHSARSRGIHASLSLQHGCCDYAQHDGLVISQLGVKPKRCVHTLALEGGRLHAVRLGGGGHIQRGWVNSPPCCAAPALPARSLRACGWRCR